MGIEGRVEEKREGHLHVARVAWARGAMAAAGGWAQPDAAEVGQGRPAPGEFGERRQLAVVVVDASSGNQRSGSSLVRGSYYMVLVSQPFLGGLPAWLSHTVPPPCLLCAPVPCSRPLQHAPCRCPGALGGISLLGRGPFYPRLSRVKSRATSSIQVRGICNDPSFPLQPPCHHLILKSVHYCPNRPNPLAS